MTKTTWKGSMASHSLVLVYHGPLLFATFWDLFTGPSPVRWNSGSIFSPGSFPDLGNSLKSETVSKLCELIQLSLWVYKDGMTGWPTKIYQILEPQNQNLSRFIWWKWTGIMGLGYMQGAGTLWMNWNGSSPWNDLVVSDSKQVEKSDSIPMTWDDKFNGRPSQSLLQ